MSIQRNLQLQGANQPSAQITYFSNSAFLKKYKQLTNREWTAEQSTILEQVVTIDKWLADLAEQNKRSGRYKKCDSLRLHWAKEVGLPGLTCGRHSPSKEDLDILALPFDTAMTPLQRKTVIKWAETKAAKNAIAATEAATNALMRQTTLLEYAAFTGSPAAVGGATPVSSGAPPEYTIDMDGSKYFGKTLHQAGENYVKWLCSPNFIWRFPRSLNLFYAVSRYTQESTNKLLALPDKAHDTFFDFWREAVPSLFEDPDVDGDRTTTSRQGRRQ